MTDDREIRYLSSNARQTALEIVSSVLIALCLLTACGGSDDPVERAKELSTDAFDTARRQGVDLMRAPCIYYPNTPSGKNSWFAFVVFPGDGSPREAALKCPGGKTLGYVALDQSGEIIEVEGVPLDWQGIER